MSDALTPREALQALLDGKRLDDGDGTPYGYMLEFDERRGILRKVSISHIVHVPLTGFRVYEDPTAPSMRAVPMNEDPT